MDPTERIVLRRKKMMFSSHFVLNDDNLSRIWEAKLLKRSDYDLIKAEPTNCGRVGRLVDVLPIEGFNFFCELLYEQNEWLSDELRTEMRAELGQLEIEDYISKESEVLVHREFGASKRLAQREKLKLSTLVALRTQFAKEVWSSQLQRARKSLEEMRKVNTEKDHQAQELATRVESFLTMNRQRLHSNHDKTPKSGRSVTHQSTRNDTRTPDGGPQRGPETGVKASKITPKADADHEKTTARDTKQTRNNSAKSTGKEETGSEEAEVEPGLALLTHLAAMIEEVVTLTEECSAERDSLRMERARLLETLKLEADDQMTPVDARLKEMVAAADHELKEAREKVRLREERVAELQHRLHEYWIESEKTIEKKDETITLTMEEVKKGQNKVRNLELQKQKLEHECRCAHNELKLCQEKTARLELNRRLGYKSASQSQRNIRLPAIKGGDRNQSLSGKRRGNKTSSQTIEN